MKIGVFLNHNSPPTEGGGFSYLDKLMRAIDNYAFDPALEVCFVGRSPMNTRKFHKAYHRLGSRFVFKAFRALSRLGILRVLAKLTSYDLHLGGRIDRRLLRKYGIDVLFFPHPFAVGVDRFPRVMTSWDVGHRTSPSFPEFRDQFESRERWYQTELLRSVAVFVESDAGKKELVEIYGIPEARVEVIPLFAGSVVDLRVSESSQRGFLADLHLEPKSYFYYPAQFWAHKNHETLVLAFAPLLARFPDRGLKLVFTGADMGSKQDVQSLARQLGVENDVRVLDFVSVEMVHTLYRNAIALTMPTFLGPTNMPPLEALHLRTAVICSDLAGHREMCGDGALYVNAGTPTAWTDAMAAILDDGRRAALIARGDRICAHSPFTIDTAMVRFEQALLELQRRFEAKQ